MVYLLFLLKRCATRRKLIEASFPAVNLSRGRAEAQREGVGCTGFSICKLRQLRTRRLGPDSLRLGCADGGRDGSRRAIASGVADLGEVDDERILAFPLGQLFFHRLFLDRDDDRSNLLILSPIVYMGCNNKIIRK